jgi:hypothetical protein
MPVEPPATDYEDAVLSILVYEFGADDRRKTDENIKRKLRRKKLGEFDEGRIGTLRSIKDEVQQEIGKGAKSEYFTGYHGTYSDMSDFDHQRMVGDLSAAFPAITPQAIKQFVAFAIYIYYLR